MLGKQLNELRLQKKVQVFEDKNIDKLTRNKYKLFRNVYKTLVVSPLHIESINQCLHNLSLINNSFNTFSQLFYLEESDSIHFFRDGDENGNEQNEIYLKHREFLTEDEENIILKKIKNFLKLCSLYSNRKEVKILLEFLIYKYEINVKYANDILLCIFPKISSSEFKNILEIIYIENNSPFFFLNNYKNNEIKPIDEYVIVQHVKKHIALYKILFEYIIDIIYSGFGKEFLSNTGTEISIPCIDLFISLTSKLIDSYIDVPVQIIEFYCNAILTLLTSCQKAFIELSGGGKKETDHNIVQSENGFNNIDRNNFVEKIDSSAIQIHYGCKFLEEFLKHFEYAIGKCKKGLNFEFIKKKIFNFLDINFLSTHIKIIEDYSDCSYFIKILIIILNIIYKNDNKICFSNYIGQKEQSILNNNFTGNDAISNILIFVKENKKNIFNNNKIKLIIKEDELLLKFLLLFYQLDNAYELSDNLMKIILANYYSLKLDIDKIESICNFILSNTQKNYIFDILFIINLISYYMFLIKKGEEDDTTLTGHGLENSVSNVEAIGLLIKKINFGYANSIIKNTHYYKIINYFIKDNYELFKNKVILFSMYNKIEEKLLNLINASNNNMKLINFVDPESGSDQENTAIEMADNAFKSLKLMHDYKKNSIKILDDKREEITLQKNKINNPSKQENKHETTPFQDNDLSEQVNNTFSNESIPMELIKKGTEFKKSKEYTLLLYTKIIHLLKINKLLFIDYLKHFQKELIYFFPSKKCFYKPIFKAFNELIQSGFHEIDKHRIGIFLEFYIVLFLIKLKKMEIKNKEKLAQDKFFKKFVTKNFVFFLIINDYIMNSKPYSSYSFFKGCIKPYTFKLSKSIFLLLCRIKNITSIEINEFFINEIKQSRLNNIKILIKYSMSFYDIFFSRIINVMFSEEVINKLCKMQETDDEQINDEINNREETNSGDKTKYIFCKKKNPKFFLLKILIYIIKIVDQKNFKESITNKINTKLNTTYNNLASIFGNLILKLIEVDHSLIFILYCKYINLFYINKSIIEYVYNTMNYFLYIYNISHLKRYISNKNVFYYIVKRLAINLRKKYNKKNAISCYRYFIMSIFVLSTNNTINYMKTLLPESMTPLLNKQKNLIKYEVADKFFKKDCKERASVLKLIKNMDETNDKSKNANEYVDTLGYKNNLQNNESVTDNIPNEGDLNVEDDARMSQGAENCEDIEHISKNMDENKMTEAEQNGYSVANFNPNIINLSFLTPKAKTMYKKEMTYEIVKYYLFAFSYLNKYFFGILISRLNMYNHKFAISQEFFKTDLLRIFLKKIMQKDKYPYKIMKIYKCLLMEMLNYEIEVSVIHLFLHLVDFYVNKLENGWCNKKENENKTVSNNINEMENCEHIEDNEYISEKLLKSTSIKGLRNEQNKLACTKIKKINYESILYEENNEEAEELFFEKLEGFYKYYKNLFEDCYFDKEKEIREICELIVNIIINGKDSKLIVQMLNIRKFSTSMLFKKNVCSQLQKLKIANIMLFKKLLSNKKRKDYNSILLMCKNLKNVKEKNKLLIFVERYMIKKKKFKTKNVNIIKILNALSEYTSEYEKYCTAKNQSDNTNVENCNIYTEFINRHIKIFKNIVSNFEINGNIFLKIIKYTTNISEHMYSIDELIIENFSLSKNNFLSSVNLFFSKNIYFFYENISYHLKPMAIVLDKLIKKKILLFVFYQKYGSFSDEMVLQNSSDEQNDDNCLSKKKRSSINSNQNLNIAKKKRKITEEGSIDINDEQEDEIDTNLDDDSNNYFQKCYNFEMFVQNENENNIKKYYDLHTFAFICTTINKLFMNDIDLNNFSALVNNIIFLFNQNYCSYIISICFINLIIKIKLEKLHSCKNYIMDILNIYHNSDIDYYINTNLLLFLSLYLCPQEYEKGTLFHKLKEETNEESELITSQLEYNNNNQNNYESVNDNNKKIRYPEYVESKLKYIKPYLKKVKNIQNLCLKIISLISIINTLNSGPIKSISYFVYFSTFKNFILATCFARNKIIHRKLNILFKKFNFKNTDTFILSLIINNFKMPTNVLDNNITERSLNDSTAVEHTILQSDIKSGRGDNFENTFLHKFLSCLNNLKSYMAFNEGYKKYLKYKENLSNPEKYKNSYDIINENYSYYDIFSELIQMTEDNENPLENVIRDSLSSFYNFILNKLLYLNYAKYPSLFKEIVAFINGKLENQTDAKYIFDVVIFVFCKTTKYNNNQIKENGNNLVSRLNEIYMLQIFSKSIFKIQLNNSMKILIISKINEILKNLFYHYTNVRNQEIKKRINQYKLIDNTDNSQDHQANTEDIAENETEQIDQNKAIEEKIKKVKSIYSEVDVVYEICKQYKKGQHQIYVLNEPMDIEGDMENNMNDEVMNNDTADIDDGCSDLSNADSIDSDFSFEKYKIPENNEKEIDKNKYTNLRFFKNEEEIEIIYFRDNWNDLKNVFYFDDCYQNSILKCICSLLLNFPIFTKKQMIELFKIFILNNKKHILVNEKNILKNNFYNLEREKKIKHIIKAISNPLKNLNIYHMFFIFSNNNLKVCLKYVIKYYKKYYPIFNDDNEIYNYNGSVVLNNSLFFYQNLIIFQNVLGDNIKIMNTLGLSLLFSLVKTYINNCNKYITKLHTQNKNKITSMNILDICCYNYSTFEDDNQIENQLFVDLRIEEHNIVTSLLYTSTKMKLTSLENLFDKLISCFEDKQFEPKHLNILAAYKSVFERRIYFIYFYRLYQNFGAILKEKNKYLFDLLNNIKSTLEFCQNQFKQTLKKVNMDRSEIFDVDNNKMLEEDESDDDIENTIDSDINLKDKKKKREGKLKTTWYWFDLGYCTLLCLYEILINEKKNQTNFTPIFFQSCFDQVISCFDFFEYLPRIHMNSDFNNSVNEDVIRNSENYSIDQISILLFDILKLILLEFYSLYLNDTEKIQIMTMRLSLKNDNNNTSYNITISILLALKHIYETIGYKELLFSLKDLYQIFSELNDHPDDEIEYVAKQWFSSISKYTS
ncbi:hypothetical protein YYG_01508 [Plasmodium vinckei petteri]|uniref:Uncharacterized protein n=1 Tax=Plasmodium vinckei petteri TaxID=138298 RepID=W7AJ28_PLAVN|nr:hypothetical protein YYG_01508 [Plasmodium vinckei petteri]CAD2108903.1 conserved Plasmodium protein, unknown function [Plasmodium vinckei petteri]